MNLLARIHSEYLNLTQIHRIQIRPALLQISDSQQIWGDWHSGTRTIRISQRLLELGSWYQLIGVLKHEMAHQIVSEVFKTNDSHGADFLRACELIGVPDEFRGASVDLQSFCLDWKNRQESAQENSKLEKIKKLLSLTSSTNPHEAELALIKAQHLGSTLGLHEGSHSNVYFHHQLKSKKGNISRLDKEMLHFLIQHYSVFGFIGQSFNLEKNWSEKTLEIIGLKENVLIADYVYQFLIRIMEQESKKTKGSRLSLHIGILEGFKSKITGSSTGLQKGLVPVALNPNLEKYANTIHPHLRSRSMGRGEQFRDHDNFHHGFKQGQQIQIHQPLEKDRKKSKPSTLALNFRAQG